MFFQTTKRLFTKCTCVRRASLTKVVKAPMLALAETHPLLVSGWIGAARSKLESPCTLNLSSTKLGWWQCGSCRAQFRRKVVDHVALNGKCPQCNAIPLLKDSKADLAFSAQSHYRPICTRSDTIHAVNPKSIKRNIVDISHFGGGELRKVLAPMLAHCFEDKGHRICFEKEEFFISPKIDGIRCLVAQDPSDGSLYYFSRQGLLFDSCDHLDEHFRKVFAVDPTAIIDGELFYNGLTETGNSMSFEELTSAVRTSKERRSKNVEALQRLVQYHAFDVSYSAFFSPTESFSTRLVHLKNIFSSVRSSTDKPRPLHLVPNTRVTSIVEAFSLRDSLISEGYEGAMLRRGSAPYAHGKRSANLLKMKCMRDAEFKIIGAIEGQGKLSDSLGAFVCVTNEGHEFTVSPSVDDTTRKALWNNWEDLVGSALTVQYQELSSYGVPRFPVGKGIRGASMSSKSWV